MLRLYSTPLSGNAYKVRLLLAQLALPFERVDVDLRAGEGRRPEFLAKNPIGRVPVLRLDDGSHLAESNAILWYLAQGTPLLPRSARSQADVLQWLFFEQNSSEPAIAPARFYLRMSGEPERFRDVIASNQKRAYTALDAMERHLSAHRFFVNDAYTIADISLYAYTHLAEEAELSLANYPAIRAWLDRVAVEPQHVTMDESVGARVHE